MALSSKLVNVLDFLELRTGEEFVGSLEACGPCPDGRGIEYMLDYSPYADYMVKLRFYRLDDDETTMTRWTMGYAHPSEGRFPSTILCKLGGHAYLEKTLNPEIVSVVLRESTGREYRLLLNKSACAFYMRCTKGRPRE